MISPFGRQINDNKLNDFLLNFENCLLGANLSANTIDYISVFYNLESLLGIGLIEMLINECVHNDPEFQYIRHGMDLLPRAIAKNLNKNAKIQYNAKVTDVDQSSRKVRVKIDCKVNLTKYINFNIIENLSSHSNLLEIFTWLCR